MKSCNGVLPERLPDKKISNLPQGYRWRVPVLLICIATVVLLAGCAPGNGAITRNVQSDLSILDDSIMVSVHKGVVTLSGQVDDESTRNAAESVVRDEKGVESVINKLVIRKAAAADSAGVQTKTPPY